VKSLIATVVDDGKFIGLVHLIIKWLLRLFWPW